MNEEIIRKLLQKMADIIADKNGIKIVVNIERKDWKEMRNMYSLFEIAFFILYFLVQAIKVAGILLIVQVVVFRTTGISLYRKSCKVAEKIIMEDF